MNVTVKEFKQALVNGGSNYDSNGTNVRRGKGGRDERAVTPQGRRSRSARASSRRTLKRVKQRKRRLLVGTAARGSRPATPSNCGKFLKLSVTKHAPKGARGRGNDLGYGKSTPDATMDDPQPSPKSPRPPSGRRRYGCSSTTRWRWVPRGMRPAHPRGA
jgi:hypothetical protein